LDVVSEDAPLDDTAGGGHFWVPPGDLESVGLDTVPELPQILPDERRRRRRRRVQDSHELGR
jgi:hypothetical protein